ncbi:MAG TPA: hypothetical protein VGS98_04085 [Thermoanaerobaculia bacterium]|nr:hypothetical protein [Thermoanaerobaculia bacterium]
MVIPLFAQVTGFKVENLWRRGSRGVVRCTARLSRPLLAEERERIERLAGTDAERTEVVYECRPDEVEERHLKLVETLAGVAPINVRRAAVGEKKPRRVPRKREPDLPRLPEPAA